MVSLCDHDWQSYPDPDWACRHQRCRHCGRIRDVRDIPGFIGAAVVVGFLAVSLVALGFSVAWAILPH